MMETDAVLAQFTGLIFDNCLGNNTSSSTRTVSLSTLQSAYTCRSSSNVWRPKSSCKNVRRPVSDLITHLTQLGRLQ